MDIPVMYSERAEQMSAYNKTLKMFQEKKISLPDAVITLRLAYKKAADKAIWRYAY